MSKNKLNAHLTQSLKESIYKIMEEESTSARNLEQFRARQDSDRAARQARGQEINDARRERTAQINAKTAELGSKDKAMATLDKSADFQRLSGTASRGQGQQNTFGGENQRTETSSGVSQMARGADGRPVSSYVNPNSPQGRVATDVASGKLPASFGKYQGNRLPMDLAKERENAGNAAFDTSINTDLGIENASGMSKSNLVSKANDVVAQRTLDIDHKLRGDDIRTHGQMPAGAVGSNTQAARQAAARRARQDNDDLADSQTLGSGQRDNALRNLSSKYATMQTGTQPGYVEPASAADAGRSIGFGSQNMGRGPDRGKPVTQDEAIYAQDVARYSRPGGVTIPATAPAPAAQPKKSNQSNTPTDFADPNRPMPTAPKPTGSTPPASFADAVNGVRQSWKTSPPRPSTNTPQDRNDGRNDVNNFNGIPKPVRREVIPARNPRSTNSMRDFDLYGPLK